MSFHDVRFPASLSMGSAGGPERRTEIVALSNGSEERNSPWSQSRRRYDAGIGMRSLDDIAELIAFFEARAGQLYAFRWKDWSDFMSCLPSQVPAFDDQVIAIGDGVTTNFQLVKRYVSGAYEHLRPISKPCVGTVLLGIQGTPLTEQVHYVVDHSTGTVQLNHPPEEGVQVTAGYEFDVPVRFDVDRIETSVSGFQAGEIPSVPVIEVRP